MKKLLRIIVLLTFSMLGAVMFLNCARDREKSAESPEVMEIAAAQAADSAEFIEKPMHTTRIDSIITSDSLVTFNLQVQTPDPCWKFARFEIQKKARETFVTVIARRKKDDVCIQIIGSMDVSIPVEISRPGKYTCRFWRQNAATLDTTITAP
jgi:hypothetical protein